MSLPFTRELMAHSHPEPSGAFAMIADFLRWSSGLFDTPLMPHGICLLVEPELILFLAVFHFIIGVSYVLISGSIGCICEGNAQAEGAVAAAGFKWFVLLCGLTHFAALLTLFFGGQLYWILTFILGVTTLISGHVAFWLYKQRDNLRAMLAGGEDGGG